MKVFFVLFLVLLASLLAGCNAATPDLSAHATQVAFIVYATETAMAPTPTATQPQPTATATLAPPSPTPTHQASTPTPCRRRRRQQPPRKPRPRSPSLFRVRRLRSTTPGSVKPMPRSRTWWATALMYRVRSPFGTVNGLCGVMAPGTPGSARLTMVAITSPAAPPIHSSSLSPAIRAISLSTVRAPSRCRTATSWRSRRPICLSPPQQPVPVPAAATAVEATPAAETAAPGRIRLSAGRYGKPLWLEVLAGDFKLVSGDTLLAGSAIGVQEDWYNIPPGWLVEIGDGDIVVQGVARAPGTQWVADAPAA